MQTKDQVKWEYKESPQPRAGHMAQHTYLYRSYEQPSFVQTVRTFSDVRSHIYLSLSRKLSCTSYIAYTPQSSIQSIVQYSVMHASLPTISRLTYTSSDNPEFDLLINLRRINWLLIIFYFSNHI
jgi:hypothetical protein